MIDHKIFGFSKQFMFFLVQNICSGIGCLIDTAFGNNINLNSICVSSAYTVITWITYAAYSIGIYAYRVILGKTKLCFYIQIAVSFVLSIVLTSLNGILPKLFNLTNVQYDLFSKCLVIHGLSLPLLAIGDFLSNYVMYTCKNRIGAIGNAIFYIIMIVTDGMVVLQGGSLQHLVTCTAVSYAVYNIYMLMASGMFKEEYVYERGDLRLILGHGINTCFDRLTGKIATITFNVFVSKLGTELYAVHSVCYALGVFTENCTNALHTFVNVRLSYCKDSLEKFCYMRLIRKRYCFTCILISYLISYILLIFMHGDVSIFSCLIYTALYCTEVIALVWYETYKAYLTSEGKTQYLKFGGIVGICIRIPIVIPAYCYGLGLLPFAIASTVDFGCRGIYFYLCCRQNLMKMQFNTMIKSLN